MLNNINIINIKLVLKDKVIIKIVFRKLVKLKIIFLI